MDATDDDITRPARMGSRAARALDGLDARFYAEQAASFSQTRRSPWPGWERCLSDALRSLEAPDAPDRGDRPLRVLDVGCGNQRFLAYLAAQAARMAGRSVDYLGVDREPALLAQGPAAEEVPTRWHVRRQRLDIVASLADGSLAAALPPADQDLTVAFGLFHHIPTRLAREALLKSLVGTLVPGGTCCISLWRFMDEPRLAARARAATDKGLASVGLARDDLEPGDYLLGWQGRPDAWRYCHHFGEGEIDDLGDAVAGEAVRIDRFASDGRNGRLNEYLVFQRLPLP